MNNKLKLAVAAALVAGASSAQAGIMIPAGDWTLDIGGVVNAYYTNTSFSGDTGAGAGPLGLGDGNADSVNNITTGLLPNYLSVSGKTRQNDLDVAFTISINPGASTTQAGFQGSQQENRQAFLTFGDASWGSIKLGKDLGIYASDAILNDMTLLGVGSSAGSLAGNTTTLGRIGTGFMYADWKSQVAYTSPNWNGFSFTVGVTQAFNAIGDGDISTDTTSAFSTRRGGSQSAYEGKASYEWTGDVAGKVWASFISQKVEGLSAFVSGSEVALSDDRATAFDIGTTVNVAGLGLTAYYGSGDGIGQTVQLAGGFDETGRSRDSDQWYVQATYALPTATKVGVSYGESTLDGNRVDGFSDIEDSMWVIGAYHPITKHLNLVAEYSESERDVNNRGAADETAKARTVSLGAILFF
ncbi:MAG: porin [Methylophilaceae bacterium]|nr:MAG: porin [Methylophilaceae bacterium]